MLKLTTDKHEASRGLSATAELLAIVQCKKTSAWKSHYSSKTLSFASKCTENRQSARSYSSRTIPENIAIQTKEWLHHIQYQPVSTTETIADNASINVVEMVIADCSPDSGVIDFQSSATTRRTTGQPDADTWTTAWTSYRVTVIDFFIGSLNSHS